jgi:hypothetical protein
MKRIMYGLLVITILIVCACAGKKQPAPSPSADLEPSMQDPSIQEPPMQDPTMQEPPQVVVEQHDRLAEITVHDILLLGGADEGESHYGLKARALRRLDSPTAIKLFGKAYDKYFTEEEAEQIADFLESPEGQSVVRILGDWLLSGKFMVEPEPPEIVAAWEQFRETAVGVKFFIEIAKVYREVSHLAVKAGVSVLKNAAPAILKSL